MLPTRLTANELDEHDEVSVSDKANKSDEANEANVAGRANKSTSQQGR
jgi:hypothetical protein